MSLLLTQAPPANSYLLNKNPIAFQFLVGEYKIAAGSPCTLNMGLGAASFNVGQYIQLKWNANVIKFTCAGVPVGPFQLRPPNAGENSLAYGAYIFGVISNNYLLRKDWIIQNSGGNGIDFTAKNNGIKYHMDYLSNSGIYPTDLSAFQDGTDPLYLDNYKTFLAVYLENSLIYESEAAVVFSDQVYKSTHSIEDLFDSYLSYTFPDLLVNSVQTRDSVNFCKSIKVQYAEKFGSPASIGGFTEVSGLNVLLGGRAFEKWNTNYSFYNTYPNAKFLTWAPDKKSVFKNQVEYLYFIYDSTKGAFNKFQTIVTVYRDDNTTQTITSSQINIKKFLICPVGFTQLALNAVSGRILKYTFAIKLIDTGNNVSELAETRTFIVNENTTYHTRVFLFGNSLGGVDVVTATGFVSETLNAEVNVGAITPDFLYDPIKGGLGANDVQISEKMHCSVGFKERAYIDFLKDFFASKEKYELINGQLYPIIVPSQEIAFPQDVDSIYSVEFDYSYAYTNKSFTPKSEVLNTGNGWNLI